MFERLNAFDWTYRPIIWCPMNHLPFANAWNFTSKFLKANSLCKIILPKHSAECSFTVYYTECKIYTGSALLGGPGGRLIKDFLGCVIQRNEPHLRFQLKLAEVRSACSGSQLCDCVRPPIRPLNSPEWCQKRDQYAWHCLPDICQEIERSIVKSYCDRRTAWIFWKFTMRMFIMFLMWTPQWPL